MVCSHPFSLPAKALHQWLRFCSSSSQEMHVSTPRFCQLQGRKRSLQLRSNVEHVWRASRVSDVTEACPTESEGTSGACCDPESDEEPTFPNASCTNDITASRVSRAEARFNLPQQTFLMLGYGITSEV